MRALVTGVNLLQDDSILEMYDLLSQNFDNCELGRFRQDLREKDWVIIAKSDSGETQGFSTIKIIETEFSGEKVSVVYSGDTIVDKRFWHANILAPVFGKFSLELLVRTQGRRLFWLLTTKGHRTYRFLPVYFNEYYPAYDRAIPADYSRLLKEVCESIFGEQYNHHSGLVKRGERTDYLNPELSMVPEKVKSDRHIAYFLKRNPEYSNGDELACICELSVENFNAIAHRTMKNRELDWIV